MTFHLLFLAFIAPAVLGQESGWGYGPGNGPSTWGERYSGCKGKSQSPINLDMKASFKTFDSFDWVGEYNEPTDMTLFNNGDTVILNGTWQPGERPAIKFDQNRMTYQLDSIHWHWGHEQYDGTEHSIRGRKYSMEMHMVMRRINPSETAEPERLVYAQLFKTGDDEITPGMNLVADHLGGVTQPNSRRSIEPFAIDELIQDQYMEMFIYRGSLTTPPCTEPVIWIVGGTPSGISRMDIKKFRSLVNKEGKEMSGNIRPTQPLNKRRVYVDVS